MSDTATDGVSTSNNSEKQKISTKRSIGKEEISAGKKLKMSTDSPKKTTTKPLTGRFSLYFILL